MNFVMTLINIFLFGIIVACAAYKPSPLTFGLAAAGCMFTLSSVLVTALRAASRGDR